MPIALQRGLDRTDRRVFHRPKRRNRPTVNRGWESASILHVRFGGTNAINLFDIVAPDIALCADVHDLGNDMDCYQSRNRGGATVIIRRDAIRRSWCDPSASCGIVGKPQSTVLAGMVALWDCEDILADEMPL
jgi:hypothetical protein